MALIAGPVLGFRGVRSGRYEVGALVVTAGETSPAVRWDGQAAAAPVLLARYGRRSAWRFDHGVEQAEQDRTVPYTVDGTEHRFAVPAAGRLPRIAYASCNGFSSLKAMKTVRDKHALWTVMAKRHAREPYHLLLLGGDQIYADEMWESLTPLKRWNELSLDEAVAAPFSPGLAARLTSFFVDLYVRRWTQPEIRPLLAAVPTVMMWDDHDIFDGWGSYSDERQESPVFQGIFGVANECFRVFQRQEDLAAPAAATLAPGLGWSAGYRVGGLGLLVLDLRSERRRDRVLSLDHWQRIYAWLDAQGPRRDNGSEPCRHLFVMSSIPVVHPSFSAVERALGALPGDQEPEDDLKDHWNSRPHKAERLRLIHRLLAFAEREQARVTIISGDVHVAALGILESHRTGPGSNATVITQLTASGIVHPGPSASLVFALEHLFPKTEDVDRGITAEMVKLPGSERCYLGLRNWLSLEPDAPGGTDLGRYWANWIVEGEEATPYTKVIHPVE